MDEHHITEPKQRILDAATALFASKGFAGVGVREIARMSGVNIAMISYYFGGKTGILKAIFEGFFKSYFGMFAHLDVVSNTREEMMRSIAREIVDFIRTNTELALVFYNEYPLDMPELTEFKRSQITSLLSMLEGPLGKAGLMPQDKWDLRIVGPALFGSIMMHFRLTPLFKEFFSVELDDAYYDRFVETLTLFFSGGIRSLTVEARSTEENSHG